MKSLMSLYVILALAACDSGLDSKRSKSAPADTETVGPVKGNQAQDQIAGRSPDAGTTADGLVMNLPDAIGKEPLPEHEARDLKKMIHPGGLAHMVPHLFDFASQMLPDALINPHSFARRPGMPDSISPVACPMYLADGSTSELSPSVIGIKRRISYKCKSEEEADGYYGHISSFLTGGKLDSCYGNTYFGVEMIKCKSFEIVLPALVDGDYDLRAIFVSADKKSRYSGSAEPKIKIESGKMTSSSKLIMKKQATDSSGSLDVEFE